MRALALWLLAASVQAQPGDAERGRALVADRGQSLCLLCHSLHGGPKEGNLAPSLQGAGVRWRPAELRERLIDSRRFNPQTVMPPYGSVEGLSRVGAAWAGKPIFTPQQIEDVVAYLATLKP